ncbi:MAG: hypothetical protein WCS75_10025 [Sphingomonas sp.]
MYVLDCILSVNLLVEAYVEDVPAQNPVQLRDHLAERLRVVEQRISELHHERETLKSDLQVTEQFITVWRRTNNVQGPPGRTEATIYQVSSEVPPPVRKPKNPPREAVLDVVLKIISARGTPVSRSDLYDALQSHGIRLYGKDPVMVLSTMLWRSQDRIVRLGSKGYWFKDRPYPPASYYPETEDLVGVADTEPEDGVIEDPEDDTEVTSRED